MMNDDNFEVIDLTDETIKPNTTITIDDSVVVSDADSVSLSNASSTPCHIPSSPSLCLSPISPLLLQPSIQLTPSPSFRKIKTPRRITPKRVSSPELQERPRKDAAKRKDDEKLQKEANRANAASKALENCMTLIDSGIPILINDSEEISLKTLFDESMLKYTLSESPQKQNTIRWKLKHTEIVDGACCVKFIDSKWTIIVMSGSDYLKRLLVYKESSDCPESIKTYLNDVRCLLQSDVILIVYNLAHHLKTERTKEAKNYRRTFKDRFEGASKDASETPDDTPSISTIGLTELQDLRLRLEMEFKKQHTDWKLHIEFFEKTTEIVQSIVRYTISIAKLNVKEKAKSSSGIDWAINMDKERAVDPTKSIDDLKRLWMTQLQQFSQVTLPIAKAIAAEYPSPWVLLSQYNELTNSEAENLLAELPVQKNLKRVIGSNISRRIHCFMTCTDPNVHIGLS